MTGWLFRPILSVIQQLKEQMMADLAAVKAALDQLTADVAAEKQQVTDAQAALSDQIAQLHQQVSDLQAQLAAGGTVTAADLDAVLTQIQAADTAVQAIQP